MADGATGAAQTAVAAAERAPSWHGGFGRLWSAAIISRFGDSLRIAALPLLATTLTDEPTLVALVTACGYLPWMLFGLIGGAVADRVDQRRAMWAVDLVRGLLIGGFAVAVAFDQATIALLMILAFTLTTLQTLFDNAATALLPAVVGPEALGSANARLQTGQMLVSSFLATPAVPLLLAAGIAVPYAANAATYLLGAALIASLRTAPRERAAPLSGSTLRADIAEGVRILWRDRILRGLCLAATLCNVGVGGLIATLVLHVTGWLDAGATVYALCLSAYGVGSVVAGFCANRIGRRAGRLRSIFVAGLVQIVPLLAIGTIRSVWAVLLGLVVFGFMGMVWNVNQITLMQQRSPTDAIGRISAAFRTLSLGATPLGAALAGVAASAWGLNTPALLAAALFVLSVAALIPALKSPVTAP
ncbi:MFS transporter [Streptomyces sp. B-S-A8]|uniref:MFS transporter n=1 Tax=Streptomyces solicavernae TaxID=3043614 RepID=A0ABT6RSI1_9ACTN|nr:MFS transporter [Streptomyces sp. B-S-A8]MDI3387387.1 MFS transporter [Streptomyces sp. B-S-A8]